MSAYLPEYINIDSVSGNTSGYVRIGENLSDACRRMYFTAFGRLPGLVIAESKIGSMSVEDIPEDIKQGWPEGIRTVPVYYFECKDGK